MLECYEAYADYRTIAERCEQLVAYRRRARSATPGPLDFTPPWRRETLAGAIRDADRDRHPRGHATATRWRRRCGPRTSTVAEDDTLAAARRRAALKARRADADRADVPARLPGRAVAVRQAPPHRGGAGGALRGVRRRDGDRQRVHRAQRPRRAAPAVRGAARARPAPATRRRSPTTRRSSRRSSTGCRRPAGSGSGSTGS